VIEHGSGSDEGTEQKDEAMFPEALEELFVRKHEYWEEEYQNEWSYPKGDVGMESETKNEAGNKEVMPLVGTESTKEEIEGKGQEKSHHNGPEANAGEINSPV